MADTNFPLTQGMDHSNLDLLTALTNNQSNINEDVSVGIKPSQVPGSLLETPDIGPKEETGFLANLDAQFNKPAKETPDEPFTFGYDMPSDAKTGRYPQYYKELNNEDLAAQKQSTLSRIGNGITKAVGTAGITFAQGIVAPIYGAAQGIQDGSFSSIYDNDAMRKLDELSKSMQNYFPNYQTEVQQKTNVGNISWWLPGGEGLFSSNFLFDKTLGMVGFMAGMAGSSYVLGGVGSVLGKSMPIFGRVAASGKLVETAEDLETIMTSGVPDAKKWATWSEKLRDIEAKAMLDPNKQATFNVLNQGQKLVASTFASAGISSSMALETMNKMREDLKQQFIDKNGYAPTEEDMAKIENISKQAGNSMFGLSTLISAYSFHGTLGKILGSFEKNEVKNFADEVVLKQGDKEVSEGIQSAGRQGKKVIGENGEVTYEGGTPETMYGAVQPEKSWYEQSAFARSTAGKVVSGIGKVWSPKAAFGMAEFNTLTPGVESYYNKKYDQKDTDVFNDLMIPGIKNIFTAEGVESMLLGGFVGKGFEHFSGEEKQRKEYEDAHREAVNGVVNTLNKHYLESFLKSQVDHFKRGSAIAAEKAALSPDDVINQKDANFDYLHNYIIQRIKYGLGDMVKSDLDQYRKQATTADGLQQLKDDGIIHKDITAEEFNKHLDKIQAISERVATKYENLNAKYGRAVDKNGKRLYTPEVIEKMLYAHEKVDNYNERMESLNKTLTAKGINVAPLIDALNRGKGVKEQSAIFSKLVDDMQVTDEEKDAYKRNIGDIARLHDRKMDLIDQYNKLKNDPFSGHNTIEENIIPKKSTSPTEPGKTIDLIHGNSQSDSEGNVVPSKVEVGKEYYAGGIVNPGAYHGKITAVKEFAKFKILGEVWKHTDGQYYDTPQVDSNGKPIGQKMIKISYDGDSKITYRSPEAFKNLKLAKVEDVENNTKAKFYIDHANDIFSLKFGRDGETKRGILSYDKEKDALIFKYRGNDGKNYEKEVSIEDFTTPRKGEEEPRLQFMDSKIKISPEEYQRLKDYEDPNKQANLMRHLEVLADTIHEKRVALENIEDKLLDAHKEVEDEREKLAQLHEDLNNISPSKGNYKRLVNSTIKQISLYEKWIKMSEDNINILSQQKQDLQFELEYIESILETPEKLRENTDVLVGDLKDTHKALEQAITKGEDLENSFRGLLFKAQNALHDAVKGVRDLWNRFTNKYPDVATEIGQQPTKANIDAYLTSNEQANINSFNSEDLSFGQPDALSPEVKSDLQEIKEAIHNAEEADVKVLTSEVVKAENNLQKVTDDVNKLKVQLKANKDLIDTFQKEFDRWHKEELLVQAFGKSKSVKAEIEQMQDSMNYYNRVEGRKLAPVTIDDPGIREKLKSTPFSAKKSLADRGLATSFVIADSEFKNTPFYNRNNKWPEREAAFTNKYAQASFKPDGTNIPELKGRKLSADNIKVIAIHKDNQGLHGFNGFLDDSYKDVNGEVVFNTGDKRDNARASIALVYVYDDAGSLYTMDKDGKLLKEVDKSNPQNMDDVVFTYLGNSLLKGTGLKEGGKDRFYDAKDFSQEELNEIESEYTTERKNILDDKTVYPTKFEMSGGKLNTIKDKNGKTIVQNNSVIDSQIISRDELSNPDIVKVATLESADRPGYSKIDNTYIPLGLTYIHTKTGPVIVNNRRLHEKDAVNIYNILRKIAVDLFDSYASTTEKLAVDKGARERMNSPEVRGLRNELKKYLRNVLFFRSPEEGEGINRNQIFFTNTGDLVIGRDNNTGAPIKFDKATFEDPQVRQDIITLLAGTGEASMPGIFHNVNNWTLKNEANQPFTEMRVDSNGNVERIYWKNYQTYLLSPTYDLDPTAHGESGTGETYTRLNGNTRPSGDRTEVPLTTNAIKPTSEKETGVVNRYIKVDGVGERRDPKPKETPKPNTKVEPTISGKPKVAEIKENNSYAAIIDGKEADVAVYKITGDKGEHINFGLTFRDGTGGKSGNISKEELTKGIEDYLNKPKTVATPKEEPFPNTFSIKAGAGNNDFILDGKSHAYTFESGREDIPGTVFNITASQKDGKVSLEFDDLAKIKESMVSKGATKEQADAFFENSKKALVERLEKAIAEETAKRVKVEPKKISIDEFIERIKSGDKLSTPEELEFYENNKKEIESRLQEDSKSNDDYYTEPEETTAKSTENILPDIATSDEDAEFKKLMEGATPTKIDRPNLTSEFTPGFGKSNTQIIQDMINTKEIKTKNC